MALDFIKHAGEVVYSTSMEEVLKEEQKLQQTQEFLDEMEYWNNRNKEVYDDYLEWV